MEDFSTDSQGSPDKSQRKAILIERAFSPADMSFTTAKSAFFDNEDEDVSPAAKSLNQSEIMGSRKTSSKILCAQCNTSLSRSKDKFKCSYCRRTLCQKHCSCTWKARPSCESCYRTLLTNEQRGKLEDGDQIERAKNRLNELEREHQHRLKHNKELEHEAVKKQETLRQKLIEHRVESQRMQERLDREHERNDKVQSQINHLMLVLEDARKSEAETAERAHETEAQLESLQTEAAFVVQQRESLAERLQALNEQSRTQLNIQKFLQLGCKPCKKRFVNSYRNELLKNKVDMDNLSFMQSVPGTPKPALKLEEKRDRCACLLM
mmetsp:Transcript_22374/g.40435  ORF Transcript_22374/g.40435 Transcript_22374/m.40435 type:complete len:323 (+) Transcript_22374:3-971(+)